MPIRRNRLGVILVSAALLSIIAFFGVKAVADEKKKENAFNELFSESAEINSGLRFRITRLGDSGLPFIGNDSTGYDVGVLNFSHEPITFSDKTFGINLYQFDETLGEWSSVEIPITRIEEPVTIAANTTTSSQGQGNVLLFTYSQFRHFGIREVRITVHGTGEITGTSYVAYSDFYFGE